MKKIFLSTILGLFILVSVLLTASLAFAADDTISLDRPGCQDVFEVIRKITQGNIIVDPSDIFSYSECILISVIQLLLEMGIIIAVFYVMLAGVSYMTAAGNATKQAAALKAISTSVISFALLLTVFATYNFVVNFIEYSDYVSKFEGAQIKIDSPPDTTNPTP